MRGNAVITDIVLPAIASFFIAALILLIVASLIVVTYVAWGTMWGLALLGFLAVWALVLFVIMKEIR